MVSRRDFIKQMGAGAAALLAAAALPKTAVSAEAKRPNIVLIYADDVGYGDLSSYGAELIQTPELDKLAENGLRFTDAYCTAATCTPSRYSLLTGSYAFRQPGATVLPGDASLVVEPGSPTMPALLQQAGYTTSIVGKWHLGLGDGDVDWNETIKPGPLEVGFDESFIIPATNDRVPCVYVKGHEVYGLSEEDDPLRISYDEPIGGLPTGHSHPEKLRYPADDQHSGTIVANISRIGYMDGGQSAWWDDEDMALVLAERAQDFIEAEQDGPFFLYLSMHENHVPRAPHEKFVGESETGLRGDAVVELDWVVGQVMEKLDELDLREETLVIFTSDNGPVFFDGYEDGALEHHEGHRPSGPYRGGKYQAFEGGTRMPFIAYWPGEIEPGVSSALFSQVDLLATLAALTGVDLPEDAGPDSRNLLPALLGRSGTGREYLVQQSNDGLGLRKGPWKYIEPGGRAGWAHNRHSLGDTALSSPQLTEGAYLFNLDDDPGETNDLSEEYPDKLEEMKELLERIREAPEVLPR